MAKNRNKITNNDDDAMVPPGEDQFMLGWDDAERLEKAKPGMARSFIKLSTTTPGFHPEYLKGFDAYLEKYVPIPEVIIPDEEIAQEFIKLIQAELNKKKQ